jgi:hypothetical protein
MAGALGQFEDGLIESIEAQDDHVVLRVRLVSGETRDLAIYTPFDDQVVCVRIDGMFVPKEEY